MSAPQYKIEVLVHGRNTGVLLGEGALWSPENHSLLWIDILGKKLNLFDSKEKKNKQIELPAMPGTVVPTSNPSIVVVPMQSGYFYVNINTSALIPADIHPDKHLPNNRSNDGKADPFGNIICGTMSVDEVDGAGSLYHWSASDNKLTSIYPNVTISNGLVWDRSHSSFYYIDTPTKKVRHFPFNSKDGSYDAENSTIAIDLLTIPEWTGGPDGMTIDIDDNIYICSWGGGRVYVFNPKSAKLLYIIEIPLAPYVTSCAFGGDNLDELYVTSASNLVKDWSEGNVQNAGSLFKVTGLGAKGFESFKWKGTVKSE